MVTIEDLDDDITALHARIATLHAHRSNLASILLSQPHLSTRLQAPPDSNIAKAISSQKTRNLTNIHRACAGVTAYKVQDPDPHAANNGNILGVSIDVALRGRFVETYHVLLTWQEENDGNKILKIHKHTIPPCIPLQHLANQWLPTPGKNGEEEVQQDLIRFGRTLRKELVSWHLRVNAVAELRKEAGVVEPKMREHEALEAHQVLNAFTSDDSDDDADSDADEDVGGPSRVVDVEADHAVRQVTITWSDRRTAVLSVSKDGRVDKAICRIKDGTRDVVMSKKALGSIAGLVRRLKA